MYTYFNDRRAVPISVIAVVVGRTPPLQKCTKSYNGSAVALNVKALKVSHRFTMTPVDTVAVAVVVLIYNF